MIESTHGYLAVTVTGAPAARSAVWLGQLFPETAVPFKLNDNEMLAGVRPGAAFSIAVNVSAQGSEVVVRISSRYCAPAPTALVSVSWLLKPTANVQMAFEH